MRVFMDVHDVEGGVSAADVAGAREADLATQRRPTRCMAAQGLVAERDHGAYMTPDKQLRESRITRRAPIRSGATPPGGMSTRFHEGERALQRRAPSGWRLRSAA
jgi:hypothetical protein